MLGIAISLGAIGIAFLLAFISSIFAPEHSTIKMFFILASELAVILALNIASKFSEYVGIDITRLVDLAFKVGIIVFVITLLYLIVYFIYSVVYSIKIKNDEL